MKAEQFEFDLGTEDINLDELKQSIAILTTKRWQLRIHLKETSDPIKEEIAKIDSQIEDINEILSVFLVDK